MQCGPTPVPTAAALVNTENIILLGSDLRPLEDATWRTDTVLLVAIDWEKPAVGVLSFPRDLLMDVPGGYGRKRINQVDWYGDYYKYPDGGFGLLRDAFQKNLGIRLDHYARLHRSGFVDIVDTLGGVDVNLECELWELSPKPPREDEFFVLHMPAGPARLDGENALKFATYRYLTADWDRARRQQVLLLAMRDQFVRPSSIPEIPRLWGIIKDNFSTDMGLKDIIRFATLAARMDTSDVHARVIGHKDTVVAPSKSGAYWLVSNGDAVYRAINELFEAPSIKAQGKPPSGCPPTPTWATLGAPPTTAPRRAASTPLPQTPTPTLTATPVPPSPTSAPAPDNSEQAPEPNPVEPTPTAEPSDSGQGPTPTPEPDAGGDATPTPEPDTGGADVTPTAEPSDDGITDPTPPPSLN